MDGFIIIGNANAVITKTVFPLIKDNKVRLGYNYITTFNTNEGEKKFGNVTWFVTYPVQKKPLTLTKTYNPIDYPKYDNYDAINVDRVKDIPYDYNGTMGVPTTILNYDLNSIEILQVGGDNLPKELFEEYLNQGNRAHYGKPLLIYRKEDKLIMPYNRLIIRRINND